MITGSPLVAEMLGEIRADLRRTSELLKEPPSQELYRMVAHHFGWDEPEPSGKAIRPLLCLLSCQAVGGDWQRAVPAASAVEFIHSFSLVHDDIQDGSRVRRHRPSVWAVWGEAQAINVGDALFGLAHLSTQRLEAPAEVVLKVNQIIDEACLQLTRGQYLDLSFELERPEPLRRYLEMIEAKTASLLGASTTAGATLGGASQSEIAHFTDYGRHLGIAFQIQDDTLAIWGSPERTGKSIIEDLTDRKPSYAALHALQNAEGFATLWRDPDTEVETLRSAMEIAGSDAAARQAAAEHTSAAVEALAQLDLRSSAGEALHELTAELLERQN